MQYPKPIISPEKKPMLNALGWGISIIVLLVVGLMRQKFETSVDFTWLPKIYSSLNAMTAILLLIGLAQVKKKRFGNHQKVMMLAMVTSLLFLIGYVIYHATTPETQYCGEGFIRYIYFTLLISHIILAAIIFPFILFTFIRAVVGEFERHKKLARIVFPLWLYVAFTGPILYFMLYPCYK